MRLNASSRKDVAYWLGGHKRSWINGADAGRLDSIEYCIFLMKRRLFL